MEPPQDGWLVRPMASFVELINTDGYSCRNGSYRENGLVQAALLVVAMKEPN